MSGRSASSISRNQTNWAVVAAAHPAWAARVFPDLPADRQVDQLWDTIARLCRLDRPDPVAAWEAHLAALIARSDYLNRNATRRLSTRAGTDLTIGLPDGPLWVSGRSVTRSGIPFTANLPTEEVFTIAAQGSRRRHRPIDEAAQPRRHADRGLHPRLRGGRVVNVTAEHGESVLRQLVETDAGAGRLGEIALVPHSSPISQSGLLFYNTLFDENAASHVALGSAYKFTLTGGDSMDDEEFERAGGNRSAIHVDFMIGSATSMSTASRRRRRRAAHASGRMGRRRSFVTIRV